VTQFRCIVADPPWKYEQRDVTGSRQPKLNGELDSGVSSVRRYGAMSIAGVCEMPVKAVAEKGSHLYLWTTNSFMAESHEIARAWGFEPKTILTWGKVKANGTPSMKTGYYFRGATEHCLFAVRGSQRLQVKHGKPTLYLSERLPHSQKPEWFYGLCEECSPGPYLELFARRKRPGWSSWGNEVESDVEIA